MPVRGLGLTQSGVPAGLVFVSEVFQHVSLQLIPMRQLSRRGSRARHGPDEATHFFHHGHEITAAKVNTWTCDSPHATVSTTSAHTTDQP
jgi:hypothetical protein